MYEGHVKLFRKLIKSAFYQDSQYVHLWVHLLLSVNWSEKRLKINGSDKFINLHPGQVLTSRDSLVSATGINRSKVERILKAFESEQQIEQQTFSKYRVISILNWSDYQSSEQQNEQQVSSKRATGEHKQEDKERKEDNIGDKSPPPRILFELWNKIISSPKVTAFTSGREAKCRLRLKNSSVEYWQDVFTRIENTPFLGGDNDRGWRADFDWAVSNDTNAAKIMEGKYDRQEKQQTALQLLPLAMRTRVR